MGVFVQTAGRVLYAAQIRLRCENRVASHRRFCRRACSVIRCLAINRVCVCVDNKNGRSYGENTVSLLLLHRRWRCWSGGGGGEDYRRHKVYDDDDDGSLGGPSGCVPGAYKN